MILSEISHKKSKRVPNSGIILELIDLVEQNPDVWVDTVRKVNDIGGYAESWELADSKIQEKMKAPHRNTYGAWLDFHLKKAKSLIIGSGVKNAFSTLESACEALLVYDSTTPPRHGEKSEVIMKMKPEQVKYHATRIPVEENGKKSQAEPEEAAPLLLAARVFLDVVKNDENDQSSDSALDSGSTVSIKSLEPKSELDKDEVQKLAEHIKQDFLKFIN